MIDFFKLTPEEKKMGPIELLSYKIGEIIGCLLMVIFEMFAISYHKILKMSDFLHRIFKKPVKAVPIIKSEIIAESEALVNKMKATKMGIPISRLTGNQTGSLASAQIDQSYTNELRDILKSELNMYGRVMIAKAKSENILPGEYGYYDSESESFSKDRDCYNAIAIERAEFYGDYLTVRYMPRMENDPRQQFRGYEDGLVIGRQPESQWVKTNKPMEIDTLVTASDFAKPIYVDKISNVSSKEELEQIKAKIRDPTKQSAFIIPSKTVVERIEIKKEENERLISLFEKSNVDIPIEDFIKTLDSQFDNWDKNVENNLGKKVNTSYNLECPYCMTLNNPKNKKCISCGALLEKETTDYITINEKREMANLPSLILDDSDLKKLSIYSEKNLKPRTPLRLTRM